MPDQHHSPHPEDGMSTYELMQKQNQFYQTALEMHREHVISQIDTLRLLIAQGVSKEELKERLDNLRKTFETDVERVQISIVSVSTHLDQVEHNIVQRIEAMAHRQAVLAEEVESRQKNSMKKVIMFQSTILLGIIGTLISVAINFLFHH